MNISDNGFGISEVAEGIAKQYREAISLIPCYAMSRPKGATRRTGIISEAVMAKESDRRERFRHNVPEYAMFAEAQRRQIWVKKHCDQSYLMSNVFEPHIQC